MGQNATATFCFNRTSGETANTSGDQTSGGEAVNQTGSTPTTSCSTCGCPAVPPTNPPNGSCVWNNSGLFSTTPGTVDDQSGQAMPADMTNSGMMTTVDMLSTDITVPGSSTKVTADIFQNANDVYGVFTVGGRQRLRVKNGLIDLRWHANQGFDSSEFARIPASGATQFYPAGRAATFGFLHWLKHETGFPSDRQNQFYSGSGGIGRSMVGSNDVPLDPSDQNQFSTSSATYFKYDTQSRAYFWYNPGDLGTQNPVYVSKIQDALGYALYYNYDGNNRLLRITGDVGQLVPYFGYDASQHINRIFLQDSNGSDNRATYFYYDGNEALQTLIDPNGGVTYFLLDSNAGIFTGYKVSKEVDPAGYITYLNYDSGNNFRLVDMAVDVRTTYFYDDGLVTGVLPRSSALTPAGVRTFKRLQFATHGFGVTDEVIGGSDTYYQYNGLNGQISRRLDPNGNETQYGVNSRHYRCRTSRMTLTAN